MSNNLQNITDVEAQVKPSIRTVFPTESIEISNAEFISAIFPDIPENASVAVCSKIGNPADNGWYAQKYDGSVALPDSNNNYVNCSTFHSAENPFNVRKENFAGYHVLLLDDLGSKKASFERLGDFELSYLTETSLGNFQGGIILKKPLNEIEAEMLHKRIVQAGLCDSGANGISRWMRLPKAINGKSNHIDKDGKPFKCKLVMWNPEARYTPEEVVNGLKLEELPKSVANRQYEGKVPSLVTDFEYLKEIVFKLNPDVGYNDWLTIAMVIFNETGGNENGFELFNEWSSKGTKYEGLATTLKKWQSFKKNHDNPVSVSSIHKMLTEQGIDWHSIQQKFKSIDNSNGHHLTEISFQPKTASKFFCHERPVKLGELDFIEAPVLWNSEPPTISSDVHDLGEVPRDNFPHLPATAKGQIPLTLPNVRRLLDYYGINVRYNVISKKIEICTPGLISSVDNEANVAMTTIVSLANMNRFVNGVQEFVNAVGDGYMYNPVADWITSKPWDGVNRLRDFFGTLTTREDFSLELKELLMHRWLLSAVAAALKPSGFHARGVLTLQGVQSKGKTSWVRALVSDETLRAKFIKVDQLIDPSNKDTLLTALSHWIVEIGELDSSFKKDVARLKGFLTNDSDKIRRPYARCDSEYPRRTVFVATVNEEQFLVDSTGNTRFWTLPVTEINYNHNIDMQQLFAQLAVDFGKGMQWWLEPEEEFLLEECNKLHRSANVVRELILANVDIEKSKEANSSAILKTANAAELNRLDLQKLLASEVLIKLGIKEPKNTQAREAGAALRELIGPPVTSGNNPKWIIFFENPFNFL